MEKYQVTYTRETRSGEVWTDTLPEAWEVATGWLSMGFYVEIWRHTDTGAKKERIK